MSSATKNKINFSEAFAILEEACDILEAGTEALELSINPERGGDFNLVRAVWDGQKYLSQACREAPLTGGDEIWPRVRAVRARTEEVLALSKDAARKARESSRNGHRTSGPEPILSIPEYLGKERKNGRRLSPAAEKRRDENRDRARAAASRRGKQ